MGWRTRSAAALAGVLVAAVALGVGQAAAAFVAPAASPLLAVGQSLIDLSPRPLKSWAIATFGTADKPVLVGGVAAVLVVWAALLGPIAVRRRWVGYSAIGGLGVVGSLAAWSRPDASAAWALPSLTAATGAAVAFGALAGALIGANAPARHAERPSAGRAERVLLDRRRFLQAALAVGGTAAVAGGFGTVLATRAARVATARAAVRIPPPTSPAPPLAPGTALRVPGLSPFVTPNEDFYRVDTALLVPQVDVRTWMLRIHGMVDRELRLDFEQLLARPLIERDVTLTCVSNPVGGRYAGNARWIGTPLRPLLEEVGVNEAATQIVSRSVDGMTIGTPTRLAMDGRDAMLAVAMNGEPLPVEHGFPVRMIVPGLYGYESATKWIADIELTTFEAYDAYWVRQGWAQEAAIKTGSRIDVPRDSSTLRAGPTVVAGVAWAQHRGISGVQVRVDGGGWSDAELSRQDTVDTWRQWRWTWDALPGDHVLAVRATDGTGSTQTGTSAPPFPNGATGWHTVAFSVS